MGKHPEEAVGFGGRAHRLTGDQYDYFSIDFDFVITSYSIHYTKLYDQLTKLIGTSLHLTGKTMREYSVSIVKINGKEVILVAGQPVSAAPKTDLV